MARKPRPTVNVGKIKGLQLGPTTPKPGSMLKQPKAKKQH